MKRTAIRLSDIAARDNLLRALYLAARGKRQGPVVAAFLADAEARLAVLAQDILQQRAPSGKAVSFIIHDPKLRQIVAPCFEDRVLHHAIINLAQARFEQMLMPCVYACRPGKGVHAAARAVQKQLQAHPWYVQVDVDGYFPSIRHDLLLKLLARRFKGHEILDLFARVLVAGAGGKAVRGLPIGALTSQYFANSFLDAGDRHLAAADEVLGHVRYMDDIVWWCADRADARRSLARVTQFLHTELDLRLKPNARIGHSADGIAWCGFRIRRNQILPSRRKLLRWRRWMEQIVSVASAGAVDSNALQRTCDHAQAILAGAESLALRQQWLARQTEV